MITIGATDAKQHFGEYLNAALYQPVMVQKSGKSVAVILSAAEYERLVAIEDAQIVHEVRQAEERGYLGAEGSAKLIGELMERNA
ncbi:MAG: type II toxin-antitoxin system prevent-host-death family antitoxin [Sterolibacterium sp.]|jgi:prevent-host-death family protein